MTPQETIRILMIEDNLAFVYFVRDALRRATQPTYVLEHAADLQSGIDALRRWNPDVVLLDLGLPDSGGLNTFERVFAEAPETPIIILTVLEDDALTIRAMEHGAQDYVLKGTLDRAMLLRSINYAVARARAEETVRMLTARLLQLQDEERRRLARALHDSTAQNLAALSMNLVVLKERCGQHTDAKTRAALEDSEKLVEKCTGELRTMSYLLHPPLLDEVGLTGAVRDFADGFSARSGIRVDLEVPADLGRLPPELETAVFRVMQECLVNIHRHSESSTASIVLRRDSRRLELIVEDAGKGLGASKAVRDARGETYVGVGIPGMRERVRERGGQFSISSSQAGTKVQAVFPVPEKEIL
jgi:signal transduction histidine kinase